MTKECLFLSHVTAETSEDRFVRFDEFATRFSPAFGSLTFNDFQDARNRRLRVAEVSVVRVVYQYQIDHGVGKEKEKVDDVVCLQEEEWRKSSVRDLRERIWEDCKEALKDLQDDQGSKFRASESIKLWIGDKEALVKLT